MVEPDGDADGAASCPYEEREWSPFSATGRGSPELAPPLAVEVAEVDALLPLDRLQLRQCFAESRDRSDAGAICPHLGPIRLLECIEFSAGAAGELGSGQSLPSLKHAGFRIGR